MSEYKIIADLTMALGIGYIFTALYLLSHPVPKKTQRTTLPRVAVLVPMRNEEGNIESCLNSLKNQDYPLHLHDIFVIDDQSTDHSPALVEPFIKQNDHFHLRKITEEQHGLSGKMNALSQVLDTIDHEIILITDADCQVPSTWIRTHIEYFDEETGMVGGFTLLEPMQHFRTVSTGIFGKVQTLDWIFLQSLAAATCNAGLPVSILGNNFGFRLQAYKDSGTYKKIGFSVTEDFALLRSIDQSGKWKIRYAIDPLNTIYSKPVANLKDFYTQRKRWLIGGKSMRLWGYFIVGLSFLAHLGIVATLLSGNFRITAALGIGLILGIDYFIIKRELKKTGLEHLKKYFLFFELFYIAYTLFFGLIFPFFKKVKWKERTF